MVRSLAWSSLCPATASVVHGRLFCTLLHHVHQLLSGRFVVSSTPSTRFSCEFPKQHKKLTLHSRCHWDSSWSTCLNCLMKWRYMCWLTVSFLLFFLFWCVQGREANPEFLSPSHAPFYDYPVGEFTPFGEQTLVCVLRSCPNP